MTIFDLIFRFNEKNIYTNLQKMVPIGQLNRTCLFIFRPNKSETKKLLFPIQISISFLNKN